MSRRIAIELCAEGQQIEDETLSHFTPLLRKHINPFGRYDFDLNRMEQGRAGKARTLNRDFRLDVATTRNSAEMDLA